MFYFLYTLYNNAVPGLFRQEGEVCTLSGYLHLCAGLLVPRSLYIESLDVNVT